jgi:hypothetical protein
MLISLLRCAGGPQHEAEETKIVPCYGEAWLLKRQRLMTESIYKEVVGTSAGGDGSAYFTVLAWSKELPCGVRRSEIVKRCV